MLRFISASWVIHSFVLLGGVHGAKSNMVAASWYAGYHSHDFPLSNVSWTKYTHLVYSFAVTTDDVSMLSLDDSDEELLPQFVSTAHENGVVASLSIGGWGGSRFFSTNVGSSSNRTQFVKTVTSLVQKYELDGIDFDWEYPNNKGIGCNTQDSNDTTNFLSFLQELRQSSVGSNLTLSASTTLVPFTDASGSSSINVSNFSQVLDYIAIMNYDVWNFYGVHGEAGPNSPMADCGVVGSATSALQAWTSAGFPADQIVLGVPAYGHSYLVSSSNATQDGTLDFYANSSGTPWGDAWDGVGNDVCGVYQEQTGVFSFWGLIDAGFLDANGTAKSDIQYAYDNCTQTPYVYNLTSQIMVSYDNVKSFTAKGEFIATNGMKGFAMWETAGDSNDILLNAIISGTKNTNITTAGTNGTTPGANSTGQSNDALPSLSTWPQIMYISALSILYITA